MNNPLWKRDFDTSFIKGNLGLFDYVKLYLPVVFGKAKRPEAEVDRTVSQFENLDHGSWLFQYLWVFQQYLHEDLSRRFDVGPITNAYRNFYPEFSLGGIVGDVTIGKGSIGHDDCFVVQGSEFGDEDVQA